MKILFLCGSLEPGRDGVGDYTRRLAEELIQQGHIVSAIALHDYHINVSWRGNQICTKEKLFVLRLPASSSWDKRIEEANRCICDFNPEWLSLQYVAFAFNSKGLQFKSIMYLHTLCRDRRLHLMFHELWVGMSVDSSRKYILWGWLQRHLIRLLITKLKPLVIHTHTRLYQTHLSKLGFTVGYLPLFGNIHNAYKHFSNDSCRTGTDLELKKEIKLVYFGSIYPNAPIDEFAYDVAEYARHYNTPISLTIVGRTGPELARWSTVWKSAGLPLEIIGERSVEEISKILSASSLGISTTPSALAEKSGTIASMREHDLQVICISFPWVERSKLYFEPLSGILEYYKGNFGKLLTNEKHSYYATQAAKVAKHLTDTLECAVI